MTRSPRLSGRWRPNSKAVAALDFRREGRACRRCSGMVRANGRRAEEGRVTITLLPEPDLRPLIVDEKWISDARDASSGIAGGQKKSALVEE